MKEKLGKILGTFLFLVLISCLIYLVFFQSKKTNKGEVKMIEVTGNYLLPASEYLAFAKLNDNTKYGGLTLPVIKGRFEMHPYVSGVDVEDEGGSKVKVYLTEKKIKAVLLAGGEPHFISDDFQILPVLPDVKFMDLPVISNPENANDLKLLSYLKNDDVEQAFKIIDAASMANKNLVKKLSEINLRNGGDIILTFSGIKPPVLFGRGEAAKKMVYLDIMLNSSGVDNNLVDSSEYIDLRFSNEIFVGAADSENNPGKLPTEQNREQGLNE